MGARLVRALGAATAVYSAAIMIRPVWLARPCALVDANGDVPASTATLIRALGARDVMIGTAMTVARDARASQTVSMCRVAADLSDAVIFGAVLSGQQRAKVAGFAAGWGALCAGAAAGLRSGRTR
ncbi:hypothetical protein [Streptomyces sp. NPDC055794]